MNFSTSGKKKAVTFSYDDGVCQDIRLIELLNKYGLKATFNLNSELLGQRGLLDRENQCIAHYKIHPEDVKYVYNGHEVAVHTLTHPNLTTLEAPEVIRQVEQDRLNLSEIVGYEVIGMAYPCGGTNHDDRTASLIRQHTGVKYSRTITCNGRFDPQADLYCFDPTAFHLDFDELFRLGERFLSESTDAPQIFYIWGHAFELDYAPTHMAQLDAFFRFISGQPDVFYGTNKEVLL